MPHLPSQATLRKLGQKKVREREGLYLLEGSAAVGDAIRLEAGPVLLLYDDRAVERVQDDEVIQLARTVGIAVRRVEGGELARISGLTTAPPVAGVFRKPEGMTPSDNAPPLVLALDRVTDPGNLGTLIRTAVFYGVREMWLGEGCADPYNPKVLRAGMGAHLQLRLCRDVKLELMLLDRVRRGARLIAAELAGQEEPRPLSAGGGTVILLLGNEPSGIAPELAVLATERVAIARRGPVDSLNVAVAGAVLLDRLLARF